MAEQGEGRAPAHREDEGISALALGSVLLRRRRMISFLGVLGAVMGLATGLLSERVYVSTASFMTQTEGGNSSALALAATQFGLRMPTNGGAWGPPIYVELLRSRSLLEPLALDTLVVLEQQGQRVAVMDLLEVMAPTSAQRIEHAINKLRGLVAAAEDKKLGAVRLTVTTRWPSVSLALTERLVAGVNRFNLETRKSQATAERQFVDARSGEAERALRGAEDRFQVFQQKNRVIASAELSFERDRLQREVVLRQATYTALLQSREEARIREVRDTPVITVFEAPRLAVDGEPRKLRQRGAIGSLAGLMLGVFISFLARSVDLARRVPDDEAREFFRLVKEIAPRFLTRGAR